MIQEVLQKINALTGMLNGLLPMKPDDQQRLNKKFRLEFNYNSNHLEGNTLTYGETELLLIFDKTTGNHDLREYEEMKAHDLAFELVKEWAADEERPLSEAGIKNLQQKLLVRPFWKEAETEDGRRTQKLITVGDYKKSSNHVRLRNGEVFCYASVEDTPMLMGELIQWYKEEEQKAELHPVVLSALLHYRFVRIHPFDDGNGRLARLLMNYVLIKCNLPPIIIRSADKRNYLFALNQADTGDLDAFVTYIADALIWSLDLTIKAGRRQSLDEPDDWKKKLHLLKKESGLADVVLIKRSSEGYQLALQNIIIPFLADWDAKTEKIEPLFQTRNCSITVNDEAAFFKNSSLMGALSKAMDSSSQFLLPFPLLQLRQLKLNVEFRGLRNDRNFTSFNGGQALVDFHDNFITISTLTDKLVTKLYSERLAGEEANELTNSLNNFFVNHLEEYIQRQL